MSLNQPEIKARTLNIGKRERIYHGDTNLPQKMRFVDFNKAIFKGNALKDDIMKREEARELRRRCPTYVFNGDKAFHNPYTHFNDSNISINDILKHKNDYAYYDKHRFDILQVIPYCSDEYFIREDSLKIIQTNQNKYLDFIMCCLSFFGLRFVQAGDVSIDNSKERKDMYQDRINYLFMKTIISSLLLYNQHLSVVLYSYYEEKMEDDDEFDYSKPFHLSLYQSSIDDDEMEEEEKENGNDNLANESKSENKDGNKDENVVKKEIIAAEQHYSIEFASHKYDCVLCKNKHIYESNMIVYKVSTLPSIIKRFQLIEGLSNDVLGDIQYFSSLTIEGFCKCILNLSFPKCLMFYSCHHEMNLRCTINEHIVNENMFPRELIIRYLYGLLVPIYYMNSCNPPLVHQNLNPDNIYFINSANNNSSIIFHICGYIESRLCPNRMVSRYVAPEVREGKEIFLNCDVYSVAIIMLELLDGWISNGQVGFNQQTMAMIGDLKGIFDVMIYPNMQRPSADKILSMLPK